MPTRRRTGAKSITVRHKKGSFKITVQVVPKKKAAKKAAKSKTRRTRKKHRAGQFKKGGGRYKR